jgi:hypothetical protein
MVAGAMGEEILPWLISFPENENFIFRSNVEVCISIDYYKSNDQFIEYICC